MPCCRLLRWEGSRRTLVAFARAGAVGPHDPGPVQPLVSRGLVRLLCARFRLIVRASDPFLVNLVREMQYIDRRGGHGCDESAQLAGEMSCWFWQSCGCNS
ncbi:hypothetical protein MPTK1_5g17160 [Marchantia polymorpha subsp. ruderalis]|uniref:Uncharacterized protein n=2 Tax=Marchantia polymorpha TaxID=3197 RepID=A0AAF6BJ92_MARPO|nr:hypothetical protein MARPO_0196s0009 [Marchantia polymorpha]BBN12076.1 hypothetical protein Mp_5g17160 [Marchantia polymorpha subsp. ruderalis]|eukprot:PTQ27497.1 hypothetical protein MARPO_0196s0009 [Marchantia polymorpha]